MQIHLTFNSMMRFLIFTMAVFVFSACQTAPPIATPAQPQTPAVDSTAVTEIQQPEPAVETQPDPGPYRAEETRNFDLVHTKLQVKFDWQKQHLLGIATLQLKPYFYPQQELVLDAKGMDIHALSLVMGSKKQALSYENDGLHLHIKLDRTYTRDESLFIEIDYTAKPNELEAGGSAAITSDKGLYFINPLGEHPTKPQQIWTQGETEASSCWFPTIDSPNQRCTQEIYITVADKFTTLSNGDLIYARKNGDGTRTDYWKMDQPHAPYLFMMAIGEYAVVKDKWQGKEVTYYVEPDYEPYAKAIFGDTPAMMTYFSELLDYPYPWTKYAQVVVRDYVSGAMENTTASVFMEDLQVDDRYLLDSDWDGIIAHELLHQWFGDLVTCESWSNLTLNEAFATYAEYLWKEHTEGVAEAQYLGSEELSGYLAESKQKQVDLIRFYYEDKEDMFDSHSYAKGGRILHMLRTLVGDEAFFSSLNLYLTDHAFESVEVHDLRLAFEQVTGQDLNWFFNQWFLASGHPQLQIEHTQQADSLILSVIQTQDLSNTPLYTLPVSIEIWQRGEKHVHNIIIEDQAQQFAFALSDSLDFVVFDSEHQLVAEINYPREREELFKQYELADGGMSRLDALQNMLQDTVVDQRLVETMLTALEDKFWPIRQLSVNLFREYQGPYYDQLVETLTALAEQDPKTTVQADALTALSSLENTAPFKDLFLKAAGAKSYAVSGSGLTAFLQSDVTGKLELAEGYESATNINVVLPLADYYALDQVPNKYNWFSSKLETSQGELLYYLVNYFGQYLINQPQEQQMEGAKLLEGYGLDHPVYYIRFSAFQALSLLEEVPGVAEIKQRIRTQEKDPRLLQVYQQMP